MLDEAFAGVDDDARAKCLGLLTAFDLDVVMTSEREWGCYREVPGLAIAQLARSRDVAAVLVSHWEWDGATRTRVERPVAAVAPVAAGSQTMLEPRTTGSRACRETAEHERLSRSVSDIERLGRLLGDPELEWLLARVRRRLEFGQPLEGNVTLADASVAQRRAVQRLLGRRPRAGRALSVSLRAVDEVVRRSGASPDGLAAAVIALTGPVVVRAEASAS